MKSNKVNLTETQKKKVAEFLSQQLHTLRTEKRLGRVHFRDEIIIKTLEDAIEAGMAEEIWK